MPLPDEDCAIVVKMNLGMPWQTVIARVNLVWFAIVVEGRQVHAPDRGGEGGIAPWFTRLHGWPA
jgi:hypothetical protein